MSEPELEISWQKFERLPKSITFGEVAVCPRCHARTRKYDYDGLVGARHKDPTVKRKPCLGCNGLGIIPNKGPIPLTMPEGME